MSICMYNCVIQFIINDWKNCSIKTVKCNHINWIYIFNRINQVNINRNEQSLRWFIINWIKKNMKWMNIVFEVKSLLNMFCFNRNMRSFKTLNSSNNSLSIIEFCWKKIWKLSSQLIYNQFKHCTAYLLILLFILL